MYAFTFTDNYNKCLIFERFWPLFLSNCISKCEYITSLRVSPIVNLIQFKLNSNNIFYIRLYKINCFLTLYIFNGSANQVKFSIRVMSSCKYNQANSYESSQIIKVKSMYFII